MRIIWYDPRRPSLGELFWHWHVLASDEAGATLAAMAQFASEEPKEGEIIKVELIGATR